jgi:hypothetical protein
MGNIMSMIGAGMPQAGAATPSATPSSPPVIAPSTDTYKPKPSSEPAAIIADRFLLLAKASDAKTPQETQERFKAILRRDPAPPLKKSRMVAWIVAIVLLVVICGIYVYYNYMVPQPPRRQKKRKTPKE